MAHRSVFGFKFNDEDYLIPNYKNINANDLALDLCLFIRGVGSVDKIIDMVKSFDIKDGEALVSLSEQSKILERLSHLSSGDKKLVRSETSDNYSLYKIVVDSLENRIIKKWKDLIRVFCEDTVRLDVLMDVGCLSYENKGLALLRSNHSCESLFVINLDTSVLEIYKMDSTCDGSFGRRYSQNCWLALVDDLPLQIILDLSENEVVGYCKEFGGNENAFKDVIRIFNNKNQLNKIIKDKVDASHKPTSKI